MREKYVRRSSCASAISEGDIFMYSCSAQLISFEVDSISKEINCAEHEYMNVPLTYRAGAATGQAASPAHGIFCLNICKAK